MYYYGETESFTTGKITPVVRDVSYTKATISSLYMSGYMVGGSFNIYLSTKENGDFNKYWVYGDYSYSTGSYEEIDEFNVYDNVTIEGLKTGTTYYCYVSSSWGNSDIVSFTTKDIDLSGVDVSHSYYPTYTSYTNWYGKEEDLTWLQGRFEYKINSNLGNGFKYGVMANDRYYYSEDTSSPYNITVNYSAGQGVAEAAEAHSRISFILEMVFNEVATEEDLRELDSLLDEVSSLSDGFPEIKVFVEIEGERMFIE